MTSPPSRLMGDDLFPMRELAVMSFHRSRPRKAKLIDTSPDLSSAFELLDEQKVRNSESEFPGIRHRRVFTLHIQGDNVVVFLNPFRDPKFHSIKFYFALKIKQHLPLLCDSKVEESSFLEIRQLGEVCTCQVTHKSRKIRSSQVTTHEKRTSRLDQEVKIKYKVEVLICASTSPMTPSWSFLDVFLTAINICVIGLEIWAGIRILRK
jgi:hypothetical protein